MPEAESAKEFAAVLEEAMVEMVLVVAAVASVVSHFRHHLA